VAYESNESGTRDEIYVVPFPKPDSRVLISTAGGAWPRWRRDGKEIFYVDLNRRVVAAEVDGRGASFILQPLGPQGQGDAHQAKGPLLHALLRSVISSVSLGAGSES